MQEIGPAWEAKQIHNTPGNVVMKDARHKEKGSIPAGKGLESTMMKMPRSPEHGVECTPHEEIRGLDTDTLNCIPVCGGQVSTDLKRVGASSVDGMGESLALADVTAAMRKAIGMTTPHASGSDSRDRFGLKDSRMGGGPFIQSCVLEEVRDKIAIRGDDYFGAPFMPVPASGEPTTPVSTRIAAGNPRDESDGAKLNAHHLDEEHRQKERHLITSEGGLVEQKPRSRKSRHEDFVGAVREALGHIPLPTGGALGPSGSSIGMTDSSNSSNTSSQHGGNQRAEQKATSGSTGDGERAIDTRTNVIDSSGDNIHVAAAAEAGGAANTTLVSDLAFASAIPAITKPGAEQWVSYTSPEGYPYLHNPWTGDSKWVVPEENENPGDATSLRIADYKVGVRRDDELVTESLGEQEDTAVGSVSDPGAEARRHGIEGTPESTALSTAGMYDADARYEVDEL